MRQLWHTQTNTYCIVSMYVCRCAVMTHWKGQQRQFVNCRQDKDPRAPLRTHSTWSKQILWDGEGRLGLVLHCAALVLHDWRAFTLGNAVETFYIHNYLRNAHLNSPRQRRLKCQQLDSYVCSIPLPPYLPPSLGCVTPRRLFKWTTTYRVIWSAIVYMSDCWNL